VNVIIMSGYPPAAPLNPPADAGMPAVLAQGVHKMPAGIAILAMAGAILLVVLSIFGAFYISEGIVEWTINLYQMLFGLIAICIEVQATPFMKTYQPAIKAVNFVFLYAKFVCTKLGRGIFYLFVGSLSISIAFNDGYVFSTMVGIYILAIGALYILFHFMPDHEAKLADATKTLGTAAVPAPGAP